MAGKRRSPLPGIINPNRTPLRPQETPKDIPESPEPPPKKIPKSKPLVAFIATPNQHLPPLQAGASRCAPHWIRGASSAASTNGICLAAAVVVVASVVLTSATCRTPPSGCTPPPISGIATSCSCSTASAWSSILSRAPLAWTSSSATR